MKNAGVLVGQNKKAGDVIRVKMQGVDVYDPNTPTENFMGTYRVTLQNIDPVWDSIQAGNNDFYNYASNVFVNVSANEMYLNPNIKKPKAMKYSHPFALHHMKQSKRTGRLVLSDTIPQGTLLTALPTLVDLYKVYCRTPQTSRRSTTLSDLASRVQKRKRIPVKRAAPTTVKAPPKKKQHPNPRNLPPLSAKRTKK